MATIANTVAFDQVIKSDGIVLGRVELDRLLRLEALRLLNVVGVTLLVHGFLDSGSVCWWISLPGARAGG